MSNGPFEWTDNMFVFNEFDDLIPLAARATGYAAKTSLYSFEGNYYIYLEYDDETMEDARKSDLYSVLSEFGVPSNMTIHRLEEYGNLVMDTDVFSTIQTYFSA